MTWLESLVLLICGIALLLAVNRDDDWDDPDGMP